MSIRLHSTRYGTGTPLLILHGLFGSGTNWRSIARRLSRQNIEVVTADLRNHGASPWVEDMSYPAMAEDVSALIEQEFKQPPFIAGHSMGGKVAMCLALQQPALIAGLIAMDIAPIVYDHSHLSLIDAMSSLNLGNISKRSEADTDLTSQITNPMLRAFLLQNLVYHNECYDWRLNLPVLAQSMASLTAFPSYAPGTRYDGPALFLRGANSHYIPESATTTIQQFFPKAVIKSIANAGHWLHAEQPSTVVTALQEFVQANTG